MSSVTLTNIEQFIEQPGRSVTRNTGALDRMTVTLLGPYYLDCPFLKGSADDTYPLMFLADITEKRDGALKELTLNYGGRTDELKKFSTQAGSVMVSEFLLSNAASEKELSYSLVDTGLVSSGAASTSGGEAPVPTYQTITTNYVLRYISQTVTYRYCSYPFPYIMPTGQMVGDLGTVPTISSQYVRFAGTSSSTSNTQPTGYTGSGGVVGPIIRMTNFSAEQLINNWFQCSVTWDARYENAG